jgi:hypothetical protein
MNVLSAKGEPFQWEGACGRDDRFGMADHWHILIFPEFRDRGNAREVHPMYLSNGLLEEVRGLLYVYLI